MGFCFRSGACLFGILFFSSFTFAFENSRSCRAELVRACEHVTGTVVVSAPVSGGRSLVEEADRILPADMLILALIPPGVDLPHPGSGRVRVFRLPNHSPSLAPSDSLAAGVHAMTQSFGDLPGPVRVFIGAEYGVDWGMALRRYFKDSSYLGPLSPPDFVSKSAIRGAIEADPIPGLLWPRVFTENDFAVGLADYVAKRPRARLVVKLDNSSGMNGLYFTQADEVFATIDVLRRQGNKHGRAPKILVEEFIDDLPLPVGAVAWKEVAFDAIAYSLPTVEAIRLKFFSAWSYEKNQKKMYVVDTLVDPLRDEFSVVREVMGAIVNRLKYRTGAVHFEMYVAVDASGTVVAGTPVVLGDPNFRFGGDNRYARSLVKHGIFEQYPDHLLMLAHFAPEQLEVISARVKHGMATVPLMSFPGAPAGAVFASDPTPLVEKIRSLPIWVEDTIPWTSKNYADYSVGEAEEFPDGVELLLIGPPEQMRVGLEMAKEVEKELSALMIEKSGVEGETSSADEEQPDQQPEVEKFGHP